MPQLTGSEKRLVAYGGWIDADEWYLKGADGGPRIRAIRGRIADLERKGYGFDHRRIEGGRRVIYRLAHVPPADSAGSGDDVAAAVADVGDPGEQLALELPAPAPRCALFDGWEEGEAA